jgi:RNA polymerase sigma factor for flagellar operon FliA
MPALTSSPAGLADFLDLVETALAPVARRLPAHVTRDDLASAGKLALVTALARAEGPVAEIRAFCFVRVRGAMLDELRRLDSLSRRRRTQARAIARAQRAFEQTHGREAGPDELAAATQLPAATIAAVLADAAAARDAGDSDWDNIPDADAPTPLETVEQADLQASLRAALDRLPANQSLALRLYYLEDAPLDTIAEQLGVSRERARQVREAGEKRLRADFVVLSLWQAAIANS